MGSLSFYANDRFRCSLVSNPVKPNYHANDRFCCSLVSNPVKPNYHHDMGNFCPIRRRRRLELEIDVVKSLEAARPDGAAVRRLAGVVEDAHAVRGRGLPTTSVFVREPEVGGHGPTVVGVDAVRVEEELPLAAADGEDAGGDRAAGFDRLLEKRVAVHLPSGASGCRSPAARR